jgi:hypothetical protein
VLHLVTVISNMPMDLAMEVLEAIANNHNLEAGALHLVKATSVTSSTSWMNKRQRERERERERV